MAEKFQIVKRGIVIISCFVLLPSYVVQYYLDIDSRVLFSILGPICLLIAMHENHSRFGVDRMRFIFILLVLGFIGSLFSGAPSQILMASTLSLNVYIGLSVWTLFADQRTLRYLLLLSFIFIGGGIISIIYAFAGGPPLATIDLVGGDNSLYLTSFTNSISDGWLRPAAIFDEPGAFAMFLTVIVLLNEAFQVNKKWSAAVLFSGLSTGSLALFFIAVAYILYKLQQKQVLLLAVILAIVTSFITLNETASDWANEFFIERMAIEDGRFVGDNRTDQIESFFEVVDEDITFKGSVAINGIDKEIDQTSNPFSIYYFYGVFVWVPYVALELWLLYASFFYFRHLRFPAMAMFLTLLQRPYIYSLYWGMAIMLGIATIYRLQKSQTDKHIEDAHF